MVSLLYFSFVADEPPSRGFVPTTTNVGKTITELWTGVRGTEQDPGNQAMGWDGMVSGPGREAVGGDGIG
jgi:hypothetical protein